VIKLKPGQILVSRTAEGDTRVFFYEVMKATTNTCELRELRKDIINQSYDEQEVIPLAGEYMSRPFRRKTTPAGSVAVQEDLYAWPWDGKSQWQSITIFIP